MKQSLALGLLASFMVAACGPASGPSGSGDINPLGLPGGDPANEGEKSGGLMPGQFVKARIDGTAFFEQIPKGNAQADQLLDKDTQMKVIEPGSSFTKVELDSGVIGFVLTVVLEPVVVDEGSTEEPGPENTAPPVVDPLPELPPSTIYDD